MTEFHIAYGRGSVQLDLPRGLDLDVLQGRPMPALDDPVIELKKVLNDPVGRKPFRQVARDKSDALIVVADHTRNNRYEVWLPEVLSQLNRAGLQDERIALYAGAGTHRAMTEDEKRERFGEEVYSRVTVHDHDCDHEERLIKVGRTDYGTTVFVDRRVFHSDMLIVTGGIQYHYFAGFSGGRKAILPGCCGRQTILENHRKAIDQARLGFADRVRAGVIVANPVSEDMHEAATLLRPDYCINVVLNNDKELAWIGAGDWGYIHRIGAQFVDEHNRVIVERPADVALIGAGGYPKDLNLFQAHKSLRHSVGALKPGAAVVWFAQCSEGEGPEEMAQWRELSLSACLARVQARVSLVTLCALSLKQLADTYDVHLVSDLPEDMVRAWGFTPHREPAKALARALPRRRGNLRWLACPDMSNLLPEPPPPPEAEVEAEEEKDD